MATQTTNNVNNKELQSIISETVIMTMNSSCDDKAKELLINHLKDVLLIQKDRASGVPLLGPLNFDEL